MAFLSYRVNYIDDVIPSLLNTNVSSDNQPKYPEVGRNLQPSVRN